VAGACAGFVALASLPASAHDSGREPAPALTPRETPLLYEPPPPGSYELPPIERVKPHELLDVRGRPTAVPSLQPGQVAVVSFVYADCGQACPTALATLQRLDRTLSERADLRGRVRLVTVSFDPERDTPARMADLRSHLAPRGAWRFVTARDRRALQPVLADYGQRVMRLVDPRGAETGLLRHVLKVFLVDESLRIRNVYSVGLMDARLILNDIQTVLAK